MGFVNFYLIKVRNFYLAGNVDFPGGFEYAYYQESACFCVAISFFLYSVACFSLLQANNFLMILLSYPF